MPQYQTQDDAKHNVPEDEPVALAIPDDASSDERNIENICQKFSETNVIDSENQEFNNEHWYEPENFLRDKTDEESEEEEPTNRRKFKVIGANQPEGSADYQDYDKIKASLKPGELFEDPEFPADYTAINSNIKKLESKVMINAARCDGSVSVCKITTVNLFEIQPEDLDKKEENEYTEQILLISEIEWTRPKDICKKPKFVDGWSRFDINQGGWGDCWFVGSLAAIADREKLIERVVPKNQSFGKGYGGIFHFRFWHYGRWLDIVVDDWLPTRKDQLVFLKSSQENEFWSALTEKAYAKLKGSYKALDGGYASVATEDLTGGIAVEYSLKNKGKNFIELWRMLLDAQQKNIITCSTSSRKEKITDEEDNEEEEELPSNHVYSVTKVASVQRTGALRHVPLVRVRNPWGVGAEWTGRWSEKSKEWDTVDEEVKKRLQVKVRADGEFWMHFADFLKEFDSVTVCYLTPTGPGSSVDSSWKHQYYEEGTLSESVSFAENRQFVVDVKVEEGKDKTSVVASLTQRDEESYIGLRMYRVPGELVGDLDAQFFENHVPEVKNETWERSASFRASVEPGKYVIVPYLAEVNIEADEQKEEGEESENKVGEIEGEKNKELSEKEEEGEEPEKDAGEQKEEGEESEKKVGEKEEEGEEPEKDGNPDQDVEENVTESLKECAFLIRIFTQ